MTPEPEKVLSYRQRVINKINRHFYGESVLDAGCGNGEDTALLLEYFKTAIGFDIEENPRWKHLTGNSLKLAADDAENISFPDNSFDTVIEKDMLHHAENPEKALKEMLRVSKKRVIVLEANRYNPIFYLHLTLMGNHQHFSQKKFKTLIESAGADFEIKHFSARVCPVNIKLFITLLNKFHDLLEKIPPYRPVIEYNLGIITKK